MYAFDDRWLLARASGALLLANLRFWPTVAPHVRRQLKKWEQLASQIEDPELRTLALTKLEEERFNSEVAATLATIAPARHRKSAIEAIVAYEVMYDYLDGLTEQPTNDPLAAGREVYRVFTDAVTISRSPTSHDQLIGGRSDGEYLAALAAAVHGALSELPAAGAISQIARRAATRCSEAQIRAHAVKQLGAKQLEQWATAEVNETDSDGDSS